MSKVSINLKRLQYALDLFKMTREDLIDAVSAKRKKPLNENEIFSQEISLSTLKKIDSIFERGLTFYLDPSNLAKSSAASIFFRKKKFNANLDLGTKRVVNRFEDVKLSLSVISKQTERPIDRILSIFPRSRNAQSVAQDLARELYPSFKPTPKEFLTSFISKLAEFNILVFEFVETWNQKERANIDGFFLSPNVIVLKRQQRSFRREIFTLAHELGHYLLNDEDVDNLQVENENISENESLTERWCNDFAFHFLIGASSEMFDKIGAVNAANDYQRHSIETISRSTHLSTLALYTRLLVENKIAMRDYGKIKGAIDEEILKIAKKERMENERQKALGIKGKGRAPKPINSPLYVSTLQNAVYEGVVSEYEFCKQLNIKPKELYRYFQ